MQHDIIDNRERKLAASVKPLLSESDKAKFAVGYFFISGFKFIADELENISPGAKGSTSGFAARGHFIS
jgi:hypothetical protein